MPFGGDLAIALFVMHPNSSLRPTDRGDQRLTVRRHRDTVLFRRSGSNTLSSPVGVSHSPDVEAEAAGIRREINPLSIGRPRSGSEVTVRINGGSSKVAI